MKGDFTRLTFAPTKHYDSVLMQQGRVQTDADWNEQVMLMAHRNRTQTGDIIGATGAPQDVGLGGLGHFVVVWGPDAQSVNRLFINQGRYYVNGLTVESEAPVQYTLQPGATLPPAQGAGIYLLYLDVWQRHITSLEDADIREVALAGADTGTRSQIVWQIRAQRAGAVGDNINAIPASTFDPPWQPDNTASTGKLDALAGSTPLENQLYRVEIHRSGDGTAAGASCKWSRDNGTVVARVLTHTAAIAAGSVWQFSIDIDRNGRDSFSSFLPGQMVELSNDQFILLRKPGVFGTITAVVGDRLTLAVPQASAPLDHVNPGDEIVNPLLGTTPTVRRWDNPWNPDLSTVTLLDVGADHMTGGRLNLERDISVKFTAGGDRYRTGDYWLIPARTASGLVGWAPNVAQLAAGEEHRYAPLALVRVQVNGTIANPATDIVDMRKVFPTLRSLGGSGGGIATGTGTANFVPKWQANNTSVLVNSKISDDGTTVAITDQLKVGTDVNAVAITRFTSEAISTMPTGNLQATVPTAGGVKTYVDAHINNPTSAHAASAIGYAGGGNWADGTTNPAATVEAQLDKILSDLAALAGAARIGAAASGSLPAGTVRSQLNSLDATAVRATVANTFSALQTFNGAAGDINPALQTTAAPTTRKLLWEFAINANYKGRFYSSTSFNGAFEVTINARWDGTQWVRDSIPFAVKWTFHNFEWRIDVNNTANASFADTAWPGFYSIAFPFGAPNNVTLDVNGELQGGGTCNSYVGVEAAGGGNIGGGAPWKRHFPATPSSITFSPAAGAISTSNLSSGPFSWAPSRFGTGAFAGAASAGTAWFYMNVVAS